MGLVCTKKHLTFAGEGASILRVPWKTAVRLDAGLDIGAAVL